MKANIYLEGAFWATIEIPGDSPLATLAQALANQANELQPTFTTNHLTAEDVNCAITLNLKPSSYPSHRPKAANL